MASTNNGIYYPDDYSSIADIPEDMKKMAESIDEKMGEQVEKQSQENTNIKNEQTIQKNKISVIEEEQNTQNEKLSSLKQEQTEQKNRLNNLDEGQITQDEEILVLKQENAELKQNLDNVLIPRTSKRRNSIFRR